MKVVVTIGEQRIDLERLGLSSGQARAVELELEPRPAIIGGEPYASETPPVDVRVDVSRTTTGFAMRLRTELRVSGRCARCLERAELGIEIDAREVEQGSARGDDLELHSPYVVDGILDVPRWLDDSLVLTLPEKILCRPDCAGLCEVCGVSFNEVDPAEHRHERPLDPRFAKLRQLIDDG